jgi:hypothetical protein
MSAPDFYFAVNAIFRHVHDTYGKEALIRYWTSLAHEHYADRSRRWAAGGPQALAQDWREFFSREPQADVTLTATGSTVLMDVVVCPAIKHLRDQHRDIVDYYCEHCDHVCGETARQAGYSHHREGGMGSCRQTFVQLTVTGSSPASLPEAAHARMP